MKNEIFTKDYEKYHRLVLKVAYERTGNIELAQDFCQKAFVAYYNNLEKIPADFVKAWLLLCVRNICVDHSRKTKIHNEVSIHDIHPECHRFICDNLAEEVIKKELLYTVLDDLKETNPDWHDVVVAVCLNGMSQEEASVCLGISVRVLRNRLYRARKYVRKKYIE